MDFFDLEGSILDIEGDMSNFDSSSLDTDFDLNDYVLNQSLDSSYNVSFGANENADGFKPDGTITLERTISGSSDSFPHYTRDGHDYVKVGNRYIQVDSGSTVTINNIKYDTV